jgi:hypothetical protein
LEPEFGSPRQRTREPVTFDGVRQVYYSGAIAWAGAASSNTVTNVIGVWTVPNSQPRPNTEGVWFRCSSWIGIDDGIQNILWQAGVESQVIIKNGVPQHHIYPWWEWLPGPETPITNFPVNAGDVVVCALGVTPGTNAGPCWIFNHTQSTGTAFYVEGPGALNSARALWIVERPAIQLPGGPGPSPLADYGEVVFTTCSALRSDNKARLDLSKAVEYDMINASDELMSSGTVMSPSSVRCSWDGIYE